MTTKVKHHLTVEPYTLQQALDLAAKVVARTRPSENHWTGSVLLEASGSILTVSATDLNICAQLQIPADGAIRAVVPAAALLGMVKALPDGAPALLEHDGTTVTLSSGTTRRFTLPLHAETDADLPWYVGAGDAPGFTITRDSLARIGRVAYACWSDHTRPILTAVLLADGHAYATDSYRAAAIPMPELAGMAPVMIPAGLLGRALAALADDVTVATNGRRLELAAWNGRVSSSTIEGEHPFTDAATRARLGLDGEPTGAVHHLPTAEMLDALKALAVAANDNRTVRIDAAPGSTVARLSASNTLRAMGAEVQIGYDGPGFTCGLNAGFLAEAADATGEDVVTIQETGPHDPAKVPSMPVRLDGGDLRQLIMPVRNA